MIFSHKSVLLNESVDALDIKPNGVYVDCTAGGGGHSGEILKRIVDGKLVCIDKDEEALSVCKQRLKSDKVIFVHSDFKELDGILNDLSIDKVDGILADLGVSSYQIDNPERGFSYMANDAPLDMRMDCSQSLSAKEIVNTYDEYKLFTIIRDYGEESFAKKIAKEIIAARAKEPIETCGQLVDIIDKSIPRGAIKKGSHPAKKTFQALRIEVNKELDGLEEFLNSASDRLNVGGRLAVITFHSLEDRIVKHCFADFVTDCICPPNLPVCVCNHKAKGILVNRKPMIPNESERQMNPRSQSAKLRIFEKK